MTAEDPYTHTKVSIDNLKKEMIITAYTGFNEKYTNIDTTVCRFLKHNFKNARASIIRNSKELDVTIEKLQESDTIRQLHSFPPGLRKLTRLSPNLIKALKRRGFLEFSVKRKGLEREEQKNLKDAINLVKESKPRLSQKKEALAEGKINAEEFVHKLKDNVSTRKEASAAIEAIMDNARRGKVNPEEMQAYVDKITGEASSEAMSAIVSLKRSDQTYDHCIDVGVIFQSSYYRIIERQRRPSIFENKSQAMMGAFLHDFGKSKIPKEVLDSTVRFDRDSREMKLMESHPTFGAELLAHLKMPDYIINMAHYHHVKQDTSVNSCYPKNVNYDSVIYETRLLSIVDAYQALVGKRKYKKSWTPPAAIRYIDALAGIEFDMNAWEDFISVMGLYPKGSLVELSDSSVGFVMSVPESELNKPQVAVIRNSDGEDLDSHSLIDLSFEKEITIKKDLDIEEALGREALKIFSGLNVSI